MTRTFSLAVWISLGAAIGCTSQPDGPELFENASGRIDERDIRALVRGNEVELVFPTQKRESGDLELTIVAKLLDIEKKDSPSLGEGSLEVEQREDRASHSLVIPLGAEIARARAAGIVISWRAELPEGTLRGRKSLYAALGSLEVQLKGATEVPEGGSVPLRVVVRDTVSAAPIAGAVVKATLSPEGAPADAPPLPLFEGTSDARGELVQALSLPATFVDGTIKVEVAHGTAQAWTRSPIRAVKERAIQLSSDKTIYKPGQTLELRTLALHSTRKTPLAGEQVLFEALDGKGNKVFKRRVTSDRFGVASIGVPTDSEANEGLWTLRASIDGARAEKKLPVERYNLPKIKVTVTPDRDFAVLGQPVRGWVEARYLFGAPVAGARVTVSAKRSPSGSVASMSGTTDGEGRSSFELAIPASSGSSIEDAPAALAIEAEVVDSAEQTETGAASIPLAAGPLVIRALLDPKAMIRGVENTLHLLVSDPAGRPLAAALNVEGLGPMPALETGADGVAELRFAPPDGATKLPLRISATDGAGRSHTRSIELPAADAKTLLIRSDRALFRAGDTAHLQVFAPAGVDRVFLDFFLGARGLDSRAIDVPPGGGAAETSIALTPEMRGLITFEAFALAGSGEVLRGAARVLVDPEDRLDIVLRSDKASYAPGEEATVQIRVRDAAGTPKVAALGVTAVDEAVFALGGEPSDDPRAHFDLDPRLLSASVSVLGRSALDLLGGGSDAEREHLARLLFLSSKDVRVPGIEYNSVREELPAVKTALEGAVRRDAVAFLKTLISRVRDHEIDYASAPTIVQAGASRLVDAFGQLYRAEVGDPRREGHTVTLISSGPDERAGTPDDVSADVHYGWIFWANEKDVDDAGNFQDGIADFDARAEAGGGPVPGNAGGPTQAPAEPAPNGSAGGSAKVRADFRETIFVNPAVITDGSGEATIRFPLADSITTWRVSALGSTADGELGSSRLGFRTFQEFFVDFDVPTTLTRGDEVELPAVVYNYLASEQTIRVELEAAPWLEMLSGAAQAITLGPSQVGAVKFRIRATRAGVHQLSLRGSAGSITDALIREARVLPGGKIDDQSVSDRLNGTRDHTISVPADGIEGGTRVTLALTPGFAGEAVQGTDALLREPNGCFEQTTSTAWPNTLVTRYLDTTGQLTPELREKSIAMVTRGYQRLLKFESPTGGFNWWGDRDPGNRILSAIMLWHLADMEGVIETDPAVKDRTLSWLVGQQRADGSWESGDALHAGNEVLGTSDVRTTAFIAWALAHTGWANDAVSRAATWLKAQSIDEADLYATALAANALAAIAPDDSVTSGLFARLDQKKRDGGEGRLSWPSEKPSWTGAGGDAAAIETTGLVAYGLFKAQAYPQNAVGAIRFITASKDSVGKWYNTQATMNALRALLAAASPRGSEAEGTLAITVNGQALPPVAVTRADGDVHRTIDLTPYVHAGDNTVRLEMTGTGELTYLLSRRAHRPAPVAPPAGPLGLSVTWDKSEGAVGETITARAVARYSGAGRRDQVIVRLGRAPGFAPRTEDLTALVRAGKVSRFEVRENDVTFYLMALASGEARELPVRFVPSLAVTAEAPASSIYAYYEPTIRAEVEPVRFTIR